MVLHLFVVVLLLSLSSWCQAFVSACDCKAAFELYVVDVTEVCKETAKVFVILPVLKGAINEKAASFPPLGYGANMDEQKSKTERYGPLASHPAPLVRSLACREP